MSDNELEQQFEFSPGSLLKQERERKKLELDYVASQLRLMPQCVADIEADNYRSDTPQAFYRGYIKNYAQLLGMDAEDVAEIFTGYAKKNNLYSQSSAKFENYSNSKTGGSYVWIMRLVTALIIIAFSYSVYYVMVEKQLWQQLINGKIEQGSKPLLENEQELDANDGSLSIENSAEQEGVNSLEQQLINQETEQQLPLELEPEPEPQSEQSTGAVQLASTALDDNSVNNDALLFASNDQQEGTGLGFSFNDECWLEVKDATGRVLMTGTKQAGHQASIQGKAPYQLVIGKISAVEINYAGSPVDLSQYSDRRIAKLSIGQ